MEVFRLLLVYRQAILGGLWVTLKLSLIVWSCGLLGGGYLGFLSARLPYTLGRISKVISFLISGTPILVLLFWLNFPAQTMLGINVDPFYTAAVALSLVNIVAVADNVRGALREFPNELVIAGRVCGLSERAIRRKIQVPLLLRRLLPQLLLIQVYLLQSTLFASLISVNEIFRVAQQINSIEYQPIAIYTALALLFWALCLPLNGVALALQRRFRHNLSER